VRMEAWTTHSPRWSARPDALPSAGASRRPWCSAAAAPTCSRTPRATANLPVAADQGVDDPPSSTTPPPVAEAGPAAKAATTPVVVILDEEEEVAAAHASSVVKHVAESSHSSQSSDALPDFSWQGMSAFDEVAAHPTIPVPKFEAEQVAAPRSGQGRRHGAT
jgi:hypothetical protein